MTETKLSDNKNSISDISSTQSNGSSEHTISDLISKLNNILTKHGNIPVVYWQYDVMSRVDGSYEEFYDFCRIDNSHNKSTLVFGTK